MTRDSRSSSVVDSKPRHLTTEAAAPGEQNLFDGLLGDGASVDVLRAVLDGVEDGIVACDASGVLRYFNRATRTMHGLPEEALPPERWSEYYGLFRADGVTPLPAEEIPLLRALREGRVEGAAMVIVPRDGARRHIVASGRSIVGSNGELVGAVVSMHEITDRKALERQREKVYLGQLEEQLEHNRRQLEIVVKGANVGVWYCPLPFDRLLWDATVKEHFYLSPDAEVTIDTFYERLHPDDRQATRHAIDQSIARKEAYDIEYRTVSPNGTDSKWIRARGRGFYDAAGQPRRFDGITIDITAHKRSELQRRDSERRFRDMADAAPAMLWITEPDGLCSFLSRGWYEYTGQTVEEGLGYGWTNAAHPDDREAAAIAFREANERRTDYEIDFRLRRADGAYRWAIDSGRPRFDAQGRFLGFVGSVIDVHSRKEAEARLREGAARLRLAIEIAQLGTFDIDLATDAVTVNDLGRKIYGWGPEERLEFSRVQGHFHPEDRARVLDEFQAALAPQGPGELSVEQRVVRSDGAVRSIRVRARAVFEGAGQKRRAVRLVGTYLDVTEQQEIEERFRQVAKSLLAAEKAARERAEEEGRLKDEFLATLSHELRTPLNAILGWSTLMGRGTLSENAVRDGVRVIERNARAQAQLIEDLLDMSRIISGGIRLEPRPVQLREVLESACETVAAAAVAKGVRIEKALDASVEPVLADPYRLQQVAWNLLHNAVKFTPRGGSVTVRLESVQDGAQISIEDTGEGIAPDFLVHVFDRFRQADGSTTRRHGGLGLGLAIVKQLVELHSGTVSASSHGIGRGSRFVVSLPTLTVTHTPKGSAFRPAPESLSPLPPSSGQVPSLAGIRVLLVDDEPDARELMQLVLEQFGAKVDVAASAAEALESLRRAPPSVLVSDIGMAGVDGYQLIRRVRELGAAEGGSTPALALTAFARAADRDRALAAGYHAHLTKPAEPAELASLVASLARTPDS